MHQETGTRIRQHPIMSFNTSGCMLGTLLTVALASPGAMADTQAPDRMPPGLLFDMVDPTLCSMPPESMSDAQLLDELQAVLDSGDPDMAPPVSGVWEGANPGELMGQGYYNHSDSRGLVVASDLLLIGEDNALHYLCLILAPHENTRMLEGEAEIVGPRAEAVSGDTFMLVAMLGERREGTFYPLSEIMVEEGSVFLEQAEAQAMSGTLEVSGWLEPMDPEAGLDGDFQATLDLHSLDHDDQMNPVNWGGDELEETSRPGAAAIDDATLEEVEALFLEDIALAIEPVMTPDSSDIIQHTIYRYDYQIFSSDAQRDMLQGERDRIFYHQEDRLIPVSRPSTTRPMPEVNALISPDFVLNEESAPAFRAFLKTLFGDHSFDDVDVDPYVHPRPDQWAFVNGTFFDDYTAFNVFTNDEGRELDVRYELRFMPQ